MVKDVDNVFSYTPYGRVIWIENEEQLQIVDILVISNYTNI